MDQIPHVSSDYLTQEEEKAFETNLMKQNVHDYFDYLNAKIQQIIEKTCNIRLNYFTSQFMVDRQGTCFLTEISNLQWGDLLRMRVNAHLYKYLKEDPYVKQVRDLQKTFKTEEIDQMRGLLKDVMYNDYQNRKKSGDKRFKLNIQSPDDILKEENAKILHPNNYYKIKELLGDSSFKNIENLGKIVNEGLSPKAKSRERKLEKSSKGADFEKSDDAERFSTERSLVQKFIFDFTPVKQRVRSNEAKENTYYPKRDLSDKIKNRIKSPLSSSRQTALLSERSQNNYSQGDSFVRLSYACTTPLDIRFVKVRNSMLEKLSKHKNGAIFQNYL